MTEEEMAEEYKETVHRWRDSKGELVQEEDVKEAFLAGLKAKTQWHDLRKNSNDLPEEPNEKMKVNETWVYVKFFDNTYGIVDKGALKNYKGVIAWCELPKFKE